MFEDKEDLLDRKEGDYSEDSDSLFGMTVNKLQLDMILSSAVFSDGTLNIFPSRPGFEHPGFKLSGGQLSFNFTNADIKEINRGPFIPEIFIHFPKNAVVKIPRDLGVTRISFSADIAYKFDLQKGTEQ
jgi:hypothetical protein